ncbi:carboxymuconolactone decarboxylase family protein [Burkholderia sp. BCC1972]|uniref:carboxymuconolactone decarboxylase family protein n=1 Tax=Burkholderia sp. BCC1972 TaxID=2817438 RepID=UPI002ABD529A|nr:carboxymuconolactone decarboxylase family protein [Burkholderia sp. BCC1972]
MSVIHAIGDEGFNSLSAALDRLDPDFKRLLVEGAYADIIARPNLSLKYRELVTVAVLATMGNADSALKYHAGGMLNTGWAPQAVLETVFDTLYYAGVPVATAGIRHLVALLRERDIDIGRDVDRLGRYESATAHMLERRQRPFDALTPKERRLATLAIVIARENRHDEVRVHLNACLHVGWTRSELTEVLIQLTGYIGWPLILPVSRIALDIFDEFAATQGGATVGQADASTGRNAPECDPCMPEASAGRPEMSAAIAGCLDRMADAASRVESVEHVKARHLTAIACLTCLARNADADALATHIVDARLSGTSQHEIVDAIVGALPHAGVLAVQWALAVASRSFASTDPHAAREHDNVEASG